MFGAFTPPPDHFPQPVPCPMANWAICCSCWKTFRPEFLYENKVVPRYRETELSVLNGLASPPPSLLYKALKLSKFLYVQLNYVDNHIITIFVQDILKRAQFLHLTCHDCSKFPLSRFLLIKKKPLSIQAWLYSYFRKIRFICVVPNVVINRCRVFFCSWYREVKFSPV